MSEYPRRVVWWAPALILTLVAVACGPGAQPEEPGTTEPVVTETTAPATDTTQAEEGTTTTATGEAVTVRAGWVSAIDQLGLPAAVEQGFFEEHGLTVELAEPFPTGVDMLNALQAGEIDVAQVGVPAIGAILQGMDLVQVGNYTGSSVQLGIDETMAMVAREGSDISGDDLSTLEGKTIGVSIGSINHLYLLGVLEEAGISPDTVNIVNTPPPEMPVALETGGLDGAVFWDPWPIVAAHQVEGAYEVMRGGGFIAFIGYINGLRDWVTGNEEVVQRFLAARAQADRWIRDNPDQGAELSTRWIPGTDLEVAQEAMQYNIQQLDPRISACNYLALHTSQQLLLEVGTIDGTFPVDEHIQPQYIQVVMEDFPEFFEDLPPIPEGAQVGTDYTFDPDQASGVCG
ncbi:MAG: ABC transporter substrate-binding protein [Acidimicrobiia bacterium]